MSNTLKTILKKFNNINMLEQEIQVLIQDSYKELDKTPIEDGTRRLEILTRIDTLREVQKINYDLKKANAMLSKVLIERGIRT